MAPKTEPRRAASHAAKPPITGSHLPPGESLRLTRAGTERLFDQQARKLLRMSGDEFRDRYQAGTLGDIDESVLSRVVTVMPRKRR